MTLSKPMEVLKRDISPMGTPPPFFFLGGDPPRVSVFLFKMTGTWGAWAVAQSVECPTLDFGSGHDPTVVG